MSIHQEIDFNAAPDRVYAALTDEKTFGAATGAPSSISRDEGGPFSNFGGMIVGRNIELVPAKRVVQAWRVKTWAPGVHSIARFELQPNGKGTRVIFDHVGFPDADREHLDQGWHANYWEPIRKTVESRRD